MTVTPWLGAYFPLHQHFSGLGGGLFKRDVSLAGGARLTFWGSGHFGMEAMAGYAPAKVAGETVNETGNTKVLLGNVKLMVALTPVDAATSVFIGAGGGLITRGSNTFDDDRSSTDLGGALDLGFRFRLGDNTASAIRLDFEDFMYSGDFGSGVNSFQNDLLASITPSVLQPTDLDLVLVGQHRPQRIDQVGIGTRFLEQTHVVRRDAVVLVVQMFLEVVHQELQLVFRQLPQRFAGLLLKHRNHRGPSLSPLR